MRYVGITLCHNGLWKTGKAYAILSLTSESEHEMQNRFDAMGFRKLCLCNGVRLELFE